MEKGGYALEVLRDKGLSRVQPEVARKFWLHDGVQLEDGGDSEESLQG